MLINNSWSNGGSGGGGDITIVGSTNNIKQTTVEMQSIPSPKNGDVCYVTNDKTLYMYNNNTWQIIPTVDVFYNKLASTNDAGHVQLTSDITLDTEDKAITPKALKVAIEEVKALIDEANSSEGWGDFNDGIDEGEGEESFEWGSW